MGQSTVYRLVKSPWYVFFLVYMFLAIAFFYLSKDLGAPQWLAFTLTGLVLGGGFLVLLYAYARYEVSDDRLFFILPYRKKEIRLGSGIAPVVVPFKLAGQNLLQLFTPSKVLALYEVQEMEQFESEVRRLCKSSEVSPVPRSSTYTENKLSRYYDLVWGLAMCIYGLYSFSQGDHLVAAFIFALDIIYLIAGTAIVAYSVLSIRNAKVCRENDHLAVYDFRGRKTGELALGAGLKKFAINFRVSNLEVGADVITIPTGIVNNRRLMYDTYAIAEGNYEFVDAGSS